VKAIVFDTTIEDGIIHIPAKLRKEAGNTMRVILLPEKEKKTKSDKTKLKRNLDIIMKGGDGKSIGDPQKWQKEIRKNRQLPFRD
jgi:hypothetical protein